MSVIGQVEILRAACCVAGLDGQVCAQERPLLMLLAEDAGVGRASLESMISTAEEDRTFYEQQFRLLKPEAESTMRTLFAVAAADGKVTQEERVILRHFADRLGLEAARFDAMLNDADQKAPPAV